jgi:hypothetical protein
MASRPTAPVRGFAAFATAAPVDGVSLVEDSVAVPEASAEAERDAEDLADAEAEDLVPLAALVRVLEMALALALALSSLAVAVGVAIATHPRQPATCNPTAQTPQNRKIHSPLPTSFTIVKGPSPRLVAQHPR